MKIEIYLNNRLHGARGWNVVPRIGEAIWIEKIPSPESAPPKAAFCEVVQVQWFNDDVDRTEPCVRLMCVHT